MTKLSSLLSTLKVSICIFLLLFLTGCASILIPSNQKITINTNHKDSKVFVSNEQVGEGKSFITKVKKDGVKQVVVQTPGYKDAYYVLLPERRTYAYAPLTILSFCFFIYPGFGDLMNASSPAMFVYPDINKLPSTNELIQKNSDQKYIRLNAIKLNVENKDKDLNDYYGIYYSNNNLVKDMEKAEKNKVDEDKKNEARELKKKKKGKILLNDEGKKISYDDTKFSEMIYKTLKKTGYIDTVNKIFSDNNNTLHLEAEIKKLSIFHINSVKDFTYEKAKVNITWFIKNTFDEIVDSINIWSYSGDFSFSWANSKNTDISSETMFGDAIDFSYYSLINDKKFIKYLKADTVFSINDDLLTINSSNKMVQDVSEATTATVTVKRKDGGHGSGFAISQDGYIITNFHVITGERLSKYADITVILSDGEEVPVKVVRCNRMRDLALLKIDKTFEKHFSLNSNKSYKKLMEVYTVGTPKSIELGQSVSLGLISNERKSNNNHLLQLSMSINPGNSGGPLFEKSGVLQGVVTSKLVGYATEGVGFAIPAYLIPSYLNLNIK